MSFSFRNIAFCCTNYFIFWFSFTSRKKEEEKKKEQNGVKGRRKRLNYATHCDLIKTLYFPIVLLTSVLTIETTFV